MKHLILLAADIFGETGLVRELAAHFEERGYGSAIVSPYAGACAFTDEEEAYAFFLQQGGVAPYAEKIRARLRDLTGPLVCIGFSAGAAALWRALAASEAVGVETAILFYGSQIRAAAALQPRCPTLLVFPAEEAHFSVPELIDRLQGRPGVYCTAVPWLHGYMNSLSVHFDRDGCRRSLVWLEEVLGRPADERRDGDIFRVLFSGD
jgi:dienelactone hydrolase